MANKKIMCCKKTMLNKSIDKTMIKEMLTEQTYWTHKR